MPKKFVPSVVKIVVHDQKTKKELKAVLRHLHYYDMETWVGKKLVPPLDRGLTRRQKAILGLLQHLYLDEADHMIEVQGE